MKIAMVTTWGEPCGIADYSRALVDALQKQLEVSVVPLEHGGRSTEYYRQLGEACNQADLAHIQHEYIFFGGRDPWNYHFQALLDAIRVPLVITSHTWLRPFTGGPWWKRLLRGARDGYFRRSGWAHFLEVGQFQRAAKVIVHSQAYARELERRGLPAQRLQVLPQGIPNSVVPGEPERARRQWGLKGRIVVLFGFLNPSKGQWLALEAWKKAPVNTTLVIVGKAYSRTEAAYARRIQRLAARFGSSVRLTGFLDPQPLADLLLAADCVLLPYTAATSSYALSLMLAYQRAVITSDIGAFQEVQAKQPCLELFRSEDPEALIEKVKLVLDDGTLRRKLQYQARRWVQQNSWDQVASELVKTYASVLTPAAPARTRTRKA